MSQGHTPSDEEVRRRQDELLAAHVEDVYAQIASKTCDSSPSGKHVLDGVGDTGYGVATCCKYCKGMWYLD